MNLKEAIKIHNELCNKEEIKKYDEATIILCEKMRNCKPKKVYYKSSKTKDYYIELPYRELTVNAEGKFIYRKHYYSCSYKYINKGKYSGGNYCLSLIKSNTKEKIEDFIDEEIVKDNLKVGGEDE